MSFQKVLVRVVSLVIVAFAVSSAAIGQGTWVAAEAKAPKMFASGNNLYCAGFIQSTAIDVGNRIIAAQDEADGWHYGQNDFLYINMGRDKGVAVGDTFAVVRPRGAVRSKWTWKSDIGFYVQEVGALEVVKVKDNVSAVRIKTSCDTFMHGDLVQLVEKRTSPVYERGEPMDIFGDASGKATGRILMSRGGAEMLTRDYIAYVDLGADDNVKVGDRLTVFRPIEKGNLTRHPNDNVNSRDYGYESDAYSGGKFSNQATRKVGDKAQGQEVTLRDVRNGRPALRKVVGEAIVLNVKEKTATIVITRTAQEIHTGDWVEIK